MTQTSCARYVEFWGPCAWKLLHSVAATAPARPTVQETVHYAAFYTSLQHTLPCPHCRDHYAAFLKRYPIEEALQQSDTSQTYVKGHHGLQVWVWQLHNEVNARSNKALYAFDDAYQTYHNRCLNFQSPFMWADPHHGRAYDFFTSNQWSGKRTLFSVNNLTVLLGIAIVTALVACHFTTIKHSTSVKGAVLRGIGAVGLIKALGLVYPVL